jgi:diaminohydroxyphosphoribosylaminopyrimidine deaminase/5-amino-6-(5-phosphoribosylamino)uracil reductase
VIAEVAPDQGRELLGTWGFAHQHGRPHVTWKVAASLDGRISDISGGPTPITGEPARQEVHDLRSRVGAIVTGTGTVVTDNPRLTSRSADGTPSAYQPLRIVLGERAIPADAAIFEPPGVCEHIRSRDLRELLASLMQRGIHSVLLECGSELAAAALQHGLVDEVRWYTAGMMLGGGSPAASPGTVSGFAQRWTLIDARAVGRDVLMHWAVPKPSMSLRDNY